MTQINLSLQNFDSEINRGTNFITNEHENNLKILINKWNSYIDESEGRNKNLTIPWMDSGSYTVDIHFRNIIVEDFRFSNGITGLYIYLDNSSIGTMSFSDKQNEIGHKVIQGDGKSKIGKLVFENIHFNDDAPSSLTITSIDIDILQFLRSINLSEKIQILGCNIDKLFIIGTDLGKILLNENKIKNMYVMTSTLYRSIFITNKLGKIRNSISKEDNLTKEDAQLSHTQMAGVFRQLKSVHDEGKNYTEGDKFYYGEMWYTLKSQYFLNPVLWLHLISSRFGTSWTRALFFIFFLGLGRLMLMENISVLSYFEIFENIINNINPYLNLKDAGNSMSIRHFIYIIFLSYGVYQFILAVRRSSKR